MTLARPLLLVSATALALAACTSPDVATDDPRTRTKQGAVAGGILGGLLGVMSSGDGGERTRAALAGTVIGAGVGAAIGYSLDQQAAELQRDFGDQRISIINNGDHLVVRMPQEILFDIDSAGVKPGLRADLQVLAGSLQKYPGSTVQVIGHTDNTGSAAHNQDLSERRAGAVTSILIGAGVAAGRLQSFGVGEDQPIATNLTPEGRALNRRVDITIRPNG
ncbi:MAG: OmpA family protein [Rhodobacteraceae bacterium]|nr:OmpA family protein [Paracoccaceae bacterium]